jgi:hypothetical protein
VSPLKIKIPSKNLHEKPTNTPIIHSVYLLFIVAPTCFGITLPSSGAFLVPSESCSIEEQSIEYSSIEQLSDGTRNAPEEGNVMPKHVGATIHNK